MYWAKTGITLLVVLQVRLESEVLIAVDEDNDEAKRWMCEENKK